MDYGADKGAGSPKRQAFTVAQINKYLKANFDEDYLLRNLRITGEISNFTAHSAGHLYLTLKDEESALKAVMFRGEAQSLDFAPANGMAVVAEGNLSVYLKTGQYQLYVRRLEPAGAGDLHLRFEQRKARLLAEGLFAPEHKRPIAENPSAIGVVTSETGAAVRDIVSVLRRRNPGVKIVLFPVLVQGEYAAQSIAAAIADANRRGGLDTLIVGRGGGSIEDLWAFNEEVVARAIYASRIPVVSAVGHETDFTIADFVADLRAATPSVSAELTVPLLSDRAALLAQGLAQLQAAMARRLAMAAGDFEQMAGHPALARVQERAAQDEQTLKRLMRRIQQAAEVTLARQEQAFAAAIAVIEAVSPMAVLRRGYSLTYRIDPQAEEPQMLIRSAGQLQKGDVLRIVYEDGTAISEVTAVRKDSAKEQKHGEKDI